MRLWHEDLISQLPRPQLLGQWLGQKACNSGLCLYPLALSSLCLSSLDHGGDG